MSDDSDLTASQKEQLIKTQSYQDCTEALGLEGRAQQFLDMRFQHEHGIEKGEIIKKMVSIHDQCLNEALNAPPQIPADNRQKNISPNR